MTETVTPPREFGSQAGMGMIGWVMAILIALLLLPVLPFLILLYVAFRLAGAGNPPE